MMIIGVGVILYIRIGWPSLIGILIVLISVPVCVKVGDRNFDILKNVNALKDKRVAITNDMMEGIKYIKVNGWELAFKKLIRTARNNEVNLFKNLAFFRSLERAVGKSIGVVSALVMFIIATYTTGLTTPKVFSVMEMAGVLKMTVLMVVLGVALYFETKVIFTRFSVIFSIEEKSMIKVDEETKSPVLREK
jgi:ABC-type multidrug transport system fused ATPase/permease subunit